MESFRLLKIMVVMTAAKFISLGYLHLTCWLDYNGLSNYKTNMWVRERLRIALVAFRIEGL